MSEDLESAVEAEETTPQGEVEESSPPWGEDFQPEKAWKTITTQRESERELKERLKQEQSVWDDEDALRERLKAAGFEIAEDEEDVDDDEDLASYEDESQSEYDKRIAALEAREQERQANAAVQQFKDHVNELAAKAEIELDDDDVEFLFTKSVNQGFTEKATEAAFEKYVERQKFREAQILERYRGSKKAPHISSSGQAASKTVDLDDPRARADYLDEKFGAIDLP